MKVQKSYIDEGPTLYLVPTPIGNIKDMTYRAVEILKEVDYIYCEDTRVTKVLLSHFNINTPLLSYHSFNEETQSAEIINKLNEGLNIALVTDAGLPGISDPGYYVSKNAIDSGFKVISLPGANAALTALVASGLPSDKFYFHGFLPSKKTQRIKELKSLQDIKVSIIFYEAPHRIKKTLDDIYEVFGDREIVIAREISKKFEEYTRANISEIINQLSEVKGEIVLIVKGSKTTQLQKDLLNLSIYDHYEYYLEKGLTSKDAMKEVASDRNISKSEVYKEVLERKTRE
ncbi:MAG TPA: 16S rRNA (cytidine(1402)-2'-O)-methyltransferase [Acholeplasmataceae bacterium]|nr:16S rRNA (cytidine(1402)-2'-O)-methyltransferase [Acholeplasmataceae bacterium]